VGQISYSDVFSIDHDHGYDEDIHVGDTVRTGSNLFPHFLVVAISGDRAWVQNTQNGSDSIAPLARCRKIISEVHADR
jgi:hypothetical protein